MAIHLCNHSVFNPPPFLLSVARSTESNGGEKTKARTRVRESPDHNRKRGMRKKDNATHGDGDWKEHASVLF